MLLDQTKKLNGLLDSAFGVVSDGDRVAYAVQGFVQFRAGEYVSSETVLNIPKDADFFGYSLNMYLQGRLIDINNSANNDRSFRPTTLTWENAAFVANEFFNTGSADFKFEIRDSVNGNYQNTALFSSSAFSAMADLNAGFQFQPLLSSWQGSLQFAVPYFIPRGESMTIRFTPLYTIPDSGDPEFGNTRREFRIVSVLQGFKSVHSFR